MRGVAEQLRHVHSPLSWMSTDDRSRVRPDRPQTHAPVRIRTAHPGAPPADPKTPGEEKNGAGGVFFESRRVMMFTGAGVVPISVDENGWSTSC